MKSVKITRIELDDPWGRTHTLIFWMLQLMNKGPVEWKDTGYDVQPEAIAAKEIKVDAIVHVHFNGRDYTRRCKMKFPGRPRPIISSDAPRNTKYRDVVFSITQVDWLQEVNRLIRDVSRDFCLTEDELLDAAYEVLHEDMEIRNFRKQVEIDGRIADGMAFVEKDKRPYKVIGFEAKTDKDNYSRLFDQLDAYLTLCDEVYLIIESKKPPADLPFYVGVIKASHDGAEIIRRAQNMKHQYNEDFWSAMLNRTKAHIGLKGRHRMETFFDAMESIKRKMIWNQFVHGFNKSYSNDYLQLTEKEKRSVRAYFNKEEE